MSDAKNIVIFDFETTGLSPKMGDRPIEIGAVRIKNGLLVERFQALMHPGIRISSFIENFTGISNKMLAEAKPCAEVMGRFCDFIGSDNLVAHNASFDKRFLDAELHRISRGYSGQISCSMLLARRVLRDAPNHKLGTLVDYLNIQTEGVYHRALFDSEMTANVWLAMINKIQQHYKMKTIPFALMQKLCKTPAAFAHRTILNWK
ncbi:DNA polymerase III, epsilon subunit [Psychromonas ingrahamii 37]|uniref:DNA-directed DNA polymerase n=1 Tax=Psychromonas ingrahamii (strain DSM 17664 / CCUG 51855 / 37) TaxID=357804 RepID=A1SVZ6_PSYIN|nr:3'-5' exonuclease [Psychromonas ingrahamii]ABM03661.1 DNA polymerase III, epsilon subunit [Psychromonas ingrahamii 37]